MLLSHSACIHTLSVTFKVNNLEGKKQKIIEKLLKTLKIIQKLMKIIIFIDTNSIIYTCNVREICCQLHKN